MHIFQNAEGVHGERKVGSPCPNHVNPCLNYETF